MITKLTIPLQTLKNVGKMRILSKFKVAEMWWVSGRGWRVSESEMAISGHTIAAPHLLPGENSINSKGVGIERS